MYESLPIPTTCAATVRGIPLSLVEEESSEILRRIDSGEYDKENLEASEILVHPINTTQSSLSQISGGVLLQTTTTGMFICESRKEDSNLLESNIALCYITMCDCIRIAFTCRFR